MPRSTLSRIVDTQCPDIDSTPGMTQLAQRDVLSEHGLREIRIDAAITISLYAIAFSLYAHQSIALFGLFVVRAFLVSQVDHAFHHGTPLDDKHFALNLFLPRWAERWMLNFNRHRTHHQNPRMPWIYLPTIADQSECDTDFLRGVLRQWNGPISLATLTPDATETTNR